jgi:hypothetical protein
VVITLILLSTAVFLIWSKLYQLKDKFHFTEHGIIGVKNGIIKWEQIKSLELKYALKGRGFYLKMKLVVNKVYHTTSL